MISWIGEATDCDTAKSHLAFIEEVPGGYVLTCGWKTETSFSIQTTYGAMCARKVEELQQVFEEKVADIGEVLWTSPLCKTLGFRSRWANIE
jgi:hypothetical protein